METSTSSLGQPFSASRAPGATELGASVDSAVSTAHSAVDGGSAKAKSAIDSTTSAAHDAVNKTADGVQAAAAAASTVVDAATEKATDLAGLLANPVRDRPLTAVAGAFAVGYLLARLGN